MLTKTQQPSAKVIPARIRVAFFSALIRTPSSAGSTIVAQAVGYHVLSPLYENFGKRGAAALQRIVSSGLNGLRTDRLNSRGATIFFLQPLLSEAI